MFTRTAYTPSVPERRQRYEPGWWKEDPDELFRGQLELLLPIQQQQQTFKMEAACHFCGITLSLSGWDLMHLAKQQLAAFSDGWRQDPDQRGRHYCPAHAAVPPPARRPAGP